jgi:lysophospholipid acyltransferase (LPLAT)-like uncharacterized protein
MRLSKRILQQPWVQKTIGVTVAEYLRFVFNTSSKVYEPPDIYDRIDQGWPIIVGMWHGHHAMMPFIRRGHLRAKVLISRHRDGEINAIASERLNVGAIRGSGDHGREFHRKGGVGGFRAMLEALQQGYAVATTADVPKVSRVAGLGIVKLAQLSGRPIYPVAVNTSRRTELDTWDKMLIPFPFGRFVGVAGTPIWVAPDADDTALEAARKAVEDGLNFVTCRAEAVADGDTPRG